MKAPKRNKVSSSKKGVSLPKTVDLHYTKINNYRSYHVDGMFGGITGLNKLYMELFIEKSPTPQISQHEITKEGMLGQEISRTGKKGIIREIEAGLIMDISVAKIMRDWLDQRIEDVEKVQQITKKPKRKKR